MFNNIIHFIIVLLIHNLSFPGDGLETSLSYALMMLFLSWLVYAGICRWSFQRLLDRAKGARADNGPLAKEYQRLVLRLSILAIFLFASDVYMFNLKYWLQSIPGFKHFSVLQGILAILLFIFYLGTIWHYSHPAYVITFQTRIVRRSFIISNLKFNLPIVFPWLILSFVFDIVSFIPWSGPESFLNEPGGQIVFFAIFLAILMVFLPRLIQYWWGCRPFEPTGRARELKAFLKGKDFKYRDLLKWPIFEGRIMTAGIMGIVPRYRYILITDALMEILSLEELKAVVAHEMGHAKYRHLVFYIFFILGYMFLSFGLFDLFRYFFVVQPFFIRMFESGESQGPTLFYLALSLPTLFSLIVYFRYVMGFFMRNFERQADLHSAIIMGSHRPTISSLEKIALYSGGSRELPSWHHFSIKERVDYLWRFSEEPGLVSRHNRFLKSSFVAYVISIVSLWYLLNFSPMKQDLNLHLVNRVIDQIDQQLIEEPNNVLPYQKLAEIYFQMGKNQEAINAYERVIHLDRSQAGALNNLAWLLVTVPDEGLRDRQRALVLAKRAVDLKRSSIFLDTLAEAYYVNGSIDEAVKTIKEAIILSTGNSEYYEKQLQKFLGHIEN